MAKKTTRDAALSRLFGNASDDAITDDAGSLAIDDTAAAVPGQKAPASKPALKKNEQKAARTIAKEGRGDPDAEPGAPSGYMGLGRYARIDGVVERITPYVRPDQAEALRLAAARKTDPRGTDISQIVQALLDEAGYRG